MGNFSWDFLGMLAQSPVVSAPVTSCAFAALRAKPERRQRSKACGFCRKKLQKKLRGKTFFIPLPSIYSRKHANELHQLK
jgi:hypothetical protein